MTQLQALVLTLLAEAPVLAVCRRWLPSPSPAPLGRCLLAGAAGSLLTHPLAWATQEQLAWRLTARQMPFAWLCVELGVTALEAVVLRVALRWNWGASLWVSLACNAVSAILGLGLGPGWSDPRGA